MLTEGKYQAKVIEAGLSDKNGKVSPYMKFDVNGESVMWYGNLTGSTPEKTQQAQEISAAALYKAGFIGLDWSDLDKPLPEVFTSKLVTIVVGLGLNGKPRVDKVYGADAPKRAFTGVAPKSPGLFAKIRKELGVKAIATEEAPF